MANSTYRAALLLAMLAMPVAGLLTPNHQKPFTGCKKLSLLHRGDPADAKTIEGDDCGNVKQIVGKWAKSKKVGELAGKAKAAQMSADLAAKNTEDAAKQALDLGKKVGQDDKAPEAVTLAAKAAAEAGKAATKASSGLKTTTDTFKGKFGDFAKDISDSDMDQIKKETEAAIEAADDAKEAGDRALQKAAEAKDKAMKSIDGALKLIESTLADQKKLSEDTGKAMQASKHAAEDVADLVKKSQAAAKKVDGKIADAKEQKPVWEAYKSDLEGREKAADATREAVIKQVDALGSARDDMDGQCKTLQGVKDAGQAAPNVLLGQSAEIDKAEAFIRKTETEFAALKAKVQSLMKDSKRLAAKIEETNKRIKDKK